MASVVFIYFFYIHIIVFMYAILHILFLSAISPV